MRFPYTEGIHARRTSVGLAVAFALVLGWSGCDSLTEVDATDVTDPGSLANANGAATLYAGARSTFTSGFAAYPLSQFLASGLIADEFVTVPPQGSWAPYDFRRLDDPGGTWPYAQLQKARISALQAIDGLQAYAPEPVARIGEMFAYIGYVETFLGENMCSGIPLSALVDQAPVFGDPLTTLELFERAAADFDSAIAYAGGSDAVVHLASVGKGRALLNQGRSGEAAAAVAGVPTAFSYEPEIFATSALEYNGYYFTSHLFSYVTTVDNEGGAGLDFVSANDPRVPLRAAEGDGPVPYYRLPQYGNPTAPVRLAGGIEARLIEAEAAYQEDPANASPSGSGWLAILNALRATAIEPALPPLADPASPESREDLIFRERAFWLFGTGHRHGDLRRLVRQYGRGVGSVFPSGASVHGVSYGDAVNMAPDASQLTNPNYQGCLDRDP